ncbi:unnamed protein product [Amoebophrya sp. A120]|nr:unnamed protein product [Amoebophrya sp. A120]|eukprot:GSA120T00006839001.1
MNLQCAGSMARVSPAAPKSPKVNCSDVAFLPPVLRWGVPLVALSFVVRPKSMPPGPWQSQPARLWQSWRAQGQDPLRGTVNAGRLRGGPCWRSIPQRDLTGERPVPVDVLP